MALVVQKYGGTSVADPERLREVAEHIVRTKRQGNQVIAVVSAMGKMTDDLIRLAGDVAKSPPLREMDMLLTAGERIAMSLLCMAIDDLGELATSFTGSQAGIVTDTAHTNARILEVKGDRIRAALDNDHIVVVAGFQGVSTSKDVTTLGRGGSDTTAVALAAAFGAVACEKYSDISGVFTADPRIVPDARRIDRISFDEMLEISATGGRVLALRSVEFARNHNVPLHVRSSFTWEPGTWVDDPANQEAPMEAAIISAVSHDTSEAKVTVTKVPDRPGVAAKMFRSLADAGVNVDMIVQNVSHDGTTDISFTAPAEDLQTAQSVLADHIDDIGAGEVTSEEHIGRVSLVGAGMKTNPGVAATMFETLAAAGINIDMISTSSIRISCVVDESQVEDAVRVLHAAFELGG